MTDANDVPMWATVAAKELVSTMRYAQKEGTHYPESEEVAGFAQFIYAAYLAHSPAPKQLDALGELLKACEPFERMWREYKAEGYEQNAQGRCIRLETHIGKDVSEYTGIDFFDWDLRKLANAASAVRAATATREEGEG